MKIKRFLSITLAICMVVTCFAGCSKKSSSSSSSKGTTSTMVEAGTCSLDTTDLFSDRDKDPSYDESEAQAIALSGSDNVSITKEGIYVLTGTLNASIVVNVGDDEKVQLVLNGVTITAKNNACILVENADKVFVTLAEGSTNTLKNSGSYKTFDSIDNIDACIFSKDDLTINGTGSLTIDAVGHGVVSKNDLKVTGGTINITADEHAMSGKQSVSILDGTFTLTAGEKGIKSKNADETNSGIIYIGGGDFTISAGTEGIEGTQIYINGGTIDITSKDDGINAASEFNNDTILLEISAGYLHINASGDGVDSNGSITVTGGESYISGATNDGDCAFDFETTGTISGGVLIATGMSGMAEIFSDADQGVILYNTNSAGTNEVVLKDSNGNELLTWTPDKSFNSVLVSCPEIEDGSTYTIMVGSSSEEITMDGNIYGSSNALGGGMGGGAMSGGKQGGIDPGTQAAQGGGQMQQPGGNMGGGQMQGGGDMTPPGSQSSQSSSSSSNSKTT